MTSTPQRPKSPQSTAETPNLDSELSPRTLEEMESVRKAVQLTDEQILGSKSPNLEVIENIEEPDVAQFSDITESDVMPELENMTLDSDQAKTRKTPAQTFTKPKSSLPEVMKQFSGKLYPDYKKIEEYKDEYSIPLVTWQYRGSTITPPKLPKNHYLNDYAFIIFTANVSHEVTWRRTIHNSPIIREVVSAATLCQVMLDNRFVIKTLGEQKRDDIPDLNFRMILPLHPMDVIRAERRLMNEIENVRFKQVFDKVPFIPLQFELPWIEFPEDFVFKFAKLKKIRPTQHDFLTYFYNYSNIRFEGKTFAANCRHRTSHWDEHPFCVNCMVRFGIPRCKDIDDDDEVYYCPYCFIMGPNAMKNWLERWTYWENRLFEAKKKNEKLKELGSNKLQNYIRTQFDADLYSSKCDYNPDWDYGYFGYCRPSWAVPIFMSWQEFWFTKDNGIDLLEKVNRHREIFKSWANAHIDMSPNVCEFKHFAKLVDLTELPTAQKSVTQPVPVAYDVEGVSKKRKRCESRPSSIERKSKSRPSTPDPTSSGQSTPSRSKPRRSKSQSTDSRSGLRPDYLRTRNDDVDYTSQLFWFETEMEVTQVVPSPEKEVTVEYISAREYSNLIQNRDDSGSMAVDSPSRAIIEAQKRERQLLKSLEAETKADSESQPTGETKTQPEGETETRLEMEIETEQKVSDPAQSSTQTNLQTEAQVKVFTDSLGNPIPTHIDEVTVVNEEGSFLHKKVISINTGLVITESMSPIRPVTPRTDLSTPGSLNLTESSPDVPSKQRVTRASQSQIPSRVYLGKTNPDVVTSHLDISYTHHSDSDQVTGGDGLSEDPVVTTSGVTEPDKTPVTSSETERVYHASPVDYKVISRPIRTTTNVTGSNPNIILSPTMLRLNRTLDLGTPLSRIWTCANRSLTYPTQDLTQDVKALRLMSIEAASGLKGEMPVREYDGPMHEGDDVVLDDMEEYATYPVTDRLATKIDQSLEMYKNSAYAPKFPTSIQANVAGCSVYSLMTTVKQPIQSQNQSYPKNSNSLNLIQSEAVRLEANTRAMGVMAENDAHLMPALLKYVSDKKEADQNDSEEIRFLNSLVNGLRLNVKMRENLIAENLAIVTAVRRRDNIERITSSHTEVDDYVSRKLSDSTPNYLLSDDD